MNRCIGITWLVGALAALAATGTWAQSAPTAAVVTLKDAFAAAWARQPEAQSLDTRREAARARRQSAELWTAEPPALEVAAKTDRFNANRGGREYELGLALPLWLPGERAQLGAVAEAELRATESRTRAAQLRTAAAVREAYWSWQRARLDVDLARARRANAARLADDVARRVRAGDLARADLHQAEGALAAADMAQAEADSELAAAVRQLRALTGTMPLPGGEFASEPEPAAEADPDSMPGAHPALAELLDRSALARNTVTLAATQSRANPELTLAATRDRGASDEAFQQTVTLGLRIPFGSETRHRARIASASAEAIEAEAELRLEHERLRGERDAARVQLESARGRMAAAARRAQLAQEARGFFAKSFDLGETDLPTLLRIDLEATEAARQHLRARIDLAAAVSARRQALGLLPE